MNINDHPFKQPRYRRGWRDWLVLVGLSPVWLLGTLGTLAIWLLIVVLDRIEGYRMPARTWEDDYVDDCRRLGVANLSVPDRDDPCCKQRAPLKEDRPE